MVFRFPFCLIDDDRDVTCFAQSSLLSFNDPTFCPRRAHGTNISRFIDGKIALDPMISMSATNTSEQSRVHLERCA
jgi:hypothetical protein